MNDLRVGYVGVEHHHRDPYFQIAATLPVEITAICEPGEEIDVADIAPLADRPDEIESAGEDVTGVVAGASTYAEPQALIESGEVDAIWITYANDAVPAIVETAVENDVDVISEKPIARTAGDLESIAERADERGVTISPTYFYRANPIVEELRERIGSGEFGEIWSIEGRFIASQLSYRDTSHYIYDAERSRGGAFQWVGLHWLDTKMYVLDDPITRVSARLAEPAAAEVDVEAGGTVQFETRRGTLGTFQSGYYLGERGKDTHLGIYGTEAQARTPVHHDAMADEPTAPLEIVSDRSDWAAAPRRTTDYEFAYEQFPAWGDYVREFFARVVSGICGEGESPTTAADAVRTLRVLDAIYESAASEQWVDVADPRS